MLRKVAKRWGFGRSSPETPFRDGLTQDEFLKHLQTQVEVSKAKKTKLLEQILLRRQAGFLNDAHLQKAMEIAARGHVNKNELRRKRMMQFKGLLYAAAQEPARRHLQAKLEGFEELQKLAENDTVLTDNNLKKIEKMRNSLLKKLADTASKASARSTRSAPGSKSTRSAPGSKPAPGSKSGSEASARSAPGSASRSKPARTAPGSASRSKSARTASGSKSAEQQIEAAFARGTPLSAGAFGQTRLITVPAFEKGKPTNALIPIPGRQAGAEERTRFSKAVAKPIPGGRTVVAKLFTGANAEHDKRVEEAKHREVYDVMRRSRTCYTTGFARTPVCCRDIIVRPLGQGLHPRISLQESAARPGTTLVTYKELLTGRPELVKEAKLAIGAAKGCLQAHGITHFDMHPGNVLFTVGDSELDGGLYIDSVRIIDWGMDLPKSKKRRGGAQTVRRALNAFVDEQVPGKTLVNWKAFANWYNSYNSYNSRKGAKIQGTPRSFLNAIRHAGRNVLMGNPNLEEPYGLQMLSARAVMKGERTHAADTLSKAYRARRRGRQSRVVARTSR